VHHRRHSSALSIGSSGIFTGSLRTLEFLEEHLPKNLGLRANQLAVLRGDRLDRELMQIVQDFGRRESRFACCCVRMSPPKGSTCTTSRTV
jgi:hypothetical protein